MAKPEVVLPPVVREKAAQLGDVGAAWLSGLPELIDNLERRWSITIGEPLNGGTASYVARTRTAEGGDAVVKLSVPDPAFTRQIRTLAAARGRGYVRLLAHDEENYAVLLEALGPPLNHLGLSPEVQIDTLCDMLPAAWQVSAATSPNAEPAPQPGGACCPALGGPGAPLLGAHRGVRHSVRRPPRGRVRPGPLRHRPW